MTRLASPPTEPRKSAENDPCEIGWRDVCHTLPDGSTVSEQIPITLADALHPHENDKIMTNTVHDRDWIYLREVIASRVAGDPTALVTSEVKILWEDGVHHSPDIAVYTGIDQPQKYRGQVDVTAEGVRPRLIVEIVSPNTRMNDIVEKVREYHQYQVPLYVVIDRETKDSLPTLLGYEFAPRRFRQLPLAGDGRLWVAPANIWIGVRDNRVVAYDGATDRELGDYVAVAAALAQEQARADAAEERAKVAEARIRQLETIIHRGNSANGS